MKAPDLLAMPLCRRCHESVHRANLGWVDVQKIVLLETLVAAVMEGVIVMERPNNQEIDYAMSKEREDNE